MSRLIFLLVLSCTIQISLADVITEVESSISETQTYEESSAQSSSSSSTFTSTTYDDCGPPVKPPKCTKPNEVLEVCPATCPFRTCGIDDTLIDCTPSPVPGDPDCLPPACRCKPQFFRDDKKNCVPWEKCPVCKNPNEVYDPCDAPCPGRRCDVDPALVICLPAPQVGSPDCLVGCRCIDGYARNSEGVCIPREKCPPKIPTCGPNEEYDPCPDCSLQTCETMNATYHCPLILADKPNCKPSCRCKKGFYRNKIGECIAASDCLKCTKPHEYFSCGGACDNVCDTIKEQNQTSCPIVNVVCNKMCYCEQGYARDCQNNCIPIKDCPGICKNPNEVYDQCDAPCPGRRCDVDPSIVRCATPPQVGSPDCLVGCRCIDGYARNSKGVCIPREKCPPKIPTCGPNEVYDPCPDCSLQTCETINATYHCPLKLADKSNCKPSCRCRKGYYRNKIGECIAASDCLKCTKPHEYFSCGGACDNVCATIKEQNQTCCPIVNVVCNKMCYCEQGYARDCKNNCIPIKDCPGICKNPNEVYDPCDAPCPGRRCDVDPRLVKCGPPPKIGSPDCLVGCRCIDGYARNSKGVCIPREKCPPKIPKCGPNEVYDPCDAPCPGRRCDVDPRLVKCGPPPKVGSPDCVVGCRCIDGYARNSEGVCIPREKCPPKIPTCGPNEEYNPCPDCSLQTCETMNATYSCPLILADKSNCKPSCRCKKGYYRNKIGECIAASDCLKCTKPHEYFSCGGACDNVCDTIKEQNQTSCPFVNKMCNKMCYCEQGYARDYKNDCIPIKDCPVCPANEKYDPCPATLCQPKRCEQAGFPNDCPLRQDGAPCPGKPGCVCRDGYLRNKKNICIPSNHCPSCGGDYNATYGCGVNCNRHCYNLNQTEPQGCILICNPNSCDCRTDKDGNKYYYDDKIKKCVLPQDCTPQCKENEVFSDCVNGGCGKKKCTDINKPVICIDPKVCESGCICAPGYLRAKNGTCVPSERCDPPPNCKVNEEFSKCGRDGCLDYYCSDLDLPPLCRDTFQCIPQCECKEGFLRASFDNDTCVPIDQCKRKCKDNEQYSDCPAATCQPQTCKEAGYPIACPIVGPDGQCSGEPGCICAFGYLRNDDGLCIPDKECPSCGGDKNAVPGCGNHCGNTCATYNSSELVICAKICNFNGCDCKKNYVYDGNLRKCVLPKKCTPTCKKNEEFTNCIEGVCRSQDCSDKDNVIGACIAIPPEKCTAGCVCKQNYLRAKNGTCVPQEQCENICKDDEQYSKCPSSLCQPQTCKQAGYPISCSVTGPADGRCPGKPGCICKTGLLRNDKGKCIPKSECPSCGGDKNAVPGCGNHCGKSCATYNKTLPCPLFCNLNGCDCRGKYIYDDNLRICVLPEKCTPTCKVNEEFSNCTNAICRPQDCANKGKNIACPATPDKTKCTTGCICKKNFLRAKNGTCVPQDQCGQTCPDGEILSDCPPINCDAEYCPKCRDDPQTCPTPKKCGKPRCICGFNRHRDRKTNKCIATSSCPAFPCDGPNEKYQSCPPVCPGETCADYLNNATCPRFKIGIVVPCKPACRCNKGYYRNPKGICVSAKKCNDYACKVNEEFSTCKNGLCRVQNCADKGKNIPCPYIAEGCCTTGCVCKKNFLRAANGTCVPEDQCHKCGC